MSLYHNVVNNNVGDIVGKCDQPVNLSHSKNHKLEHPNPGNVQSCINLFHPSYPTNSLISTVQYFINPGKSCHLKTYSAWPSRINARRQYSSSFITPVHSSVVY